MIEHEGLDDLLADLQRKNKAVREQLRPVVVDHAARSADRMRVNIPRDSGRTADSVTSDTSARGTANSVQASAGPTWFVARFLEYGTVKMAPRPFLDKSIEEPPFEKDCADIAVRDL